MHAGLGLLVVVLTSSLLGCAPTSSATPDCDQVAGRACRDSWEAAQPWLLAQDGEIEDAVVSLGGSGGVCPTDGGCADLISVTVAYRLGVVHTITLEEDGANLRVVRSNRIVPGG